MGGADECEELLDEPWRAVPASEARWLRPHVPHLVQRMSAAVRRQVPEYGRRDDDVYGKVVEQASTRAVHHFLDLIEDPSASWREVHQTYFDIGYGEALEDRGLEHLQNALRVSSRVAWRLLAEEAERHGKSRALIARLAEANFAYLDALASAAAHGYAKATEKAAGERERRRARLIGLLLADPPAPAEAVEEQAVRTGWPLPQLLSVVLLVPRKQVAEGPSGLPPQLLSGHDEGRPLLVVPDPDGPGRAADLAATLAGWTGAMGPAVPVAEAATSLLWARRTLDLVLAGTVSGQPTRRAGFVAKAEDHLPRLLLREGGGLVSRIAARRLAPLSRAGSRQAPRLAETLLECMKNGFNATEAAAVLKVHPQTVRYRLARLQELFGADLEDPRTRLEMMLLLHVWIDEFQGDKS
ncbi:PucR-like helix-turn-helix protein [Actinocorallia herbida]|uniref:PucR-like helix-turn-helix protein n=1 Tax=Actinocorallia herbida TaxID=58109 RepID=A0A3N1DBH1_9ACTN|nr:helix-turn-helix domain-containing protein [Actinocorallia herbida]ROO90877.1 PucR-like helix-turn-helix protein [Actinocorallia herbida]